MTFRSIPVTALLVIFALAGSSCYEFDRVGAETATLKKAPPHTCNSGCYALQSSVKISNSNKYDLCLSSRYGDKSVTQFVYLLKSRSVPLDYDYRVVPADFAPDFSEADRQQIVNGLRNGTNIRIKPGQSHSWIVETGYDFKVEPGQVISYLKIYTYPCEPSDATAPNYHVIDVYNEITVP